MSSREAGSSGPAAFGPAWWLPGPHPQTLWGRLTRGRRLVTFRRELLEAPDGDELVLDHVDGPAGSPRVLLLHGLEGSSYSVYIQGFLRKIAARGWRGAALNFRSCARDPRALSRMLPNRRARLYHSGETSDLDFVARSLAAREPGAPLLAIGVSLGGNVLLKWLGEQGNAAPVAAAAAVSTPYDLAASARHLETPLGRVYVGSFLTTLRGKAFEAARRFPEAASRIDLARTRSARSFWEFDDAANAPLHGFTGADDYYRRASSLGFLPGITAPTLCLSAEDDPFLPPEALARARAAASPAATFATTPRGRAHRLDLRARALAASLLGRRVRRRLAGRAPQRVWLGGSSHIWCVMRQEPSGWRRRMFRNVPAFGGGLRPVSVPATQLTAECPLR